MLHNQIVQQMCVRIREPGRRWGRIRETSFGRQVGIPNEQHSPGHSGCHVPPDRTEHHHGSPSHVLAAVIAGSLHNRSSPRVADRKALTHRAGDKQPATCGTVQAGIAGAMRHTLPADAWPNDDDAPTHSFAYPIVASSIEIDRHSAGEEGTQTLPCRSNQSN